MTDAGDAADDGAGRPQQLQRGSHFQHVGAIEVIIGVRGGQRVYAEGERSVDETAGHDPGRALPEGHGHGGGHRTQRGQGAGPGQYRAAIAMVG